MTDTALNKEINSYFRLLTPAQKISILGLIKSFTTAEQNIQRISKKQYNMELEAAEKSIAEGNFLTHEEVLKLVGSI